MALDIFRDIAYTIDDVEVVEYENNKPIIKRESTENIPHKHRRPPFKFSMVGIKLGDLVVFDPLNIKVKVVTYDSVEYNNRIYKLSPFVGTFLPEDKQTPSKAYRCRNTFHTTERF